LGEHFRNSLAERTFEALGEEQNVGLQDWFGIALLGGGGGVRAGWSADLRDKGVRGVGGGCEGELFLEGREGRNLGESATERNCHPRF